MTKRIGVVAVFLVGCAVGGVSSQLVVPKASAQQAATLTKWEYQCIDNLDPVSLQRFGAEGWEISAAVSDGKRGGLHICFKRPKL